MGSVAIDFWSHTVWSVDGPVSIKRERDEYLIMDPSSGVTWFYERPLPFNRAETRECNVLSETL